MVFKAEDVMATEWRSPQGQPADRQDDSDIPLRIYNCNRLGMQASPPRARLGNWLRRG